MLAGEPGQAPDIGCEIPRTFLVKAHTRVKDLLHVMKTVRARREGRGLSPRTKDNCEEKEHVAHTTFGNDPLLIVSCRHREDAQSCPRLSW
jgi:hypothetical protein